MNALLKSETLDVAGDLDLIELATQWNDPRLLSFLIGYLHRSSTTAPVQVEQAMDAVSEILDDEQVTALFEHYRENASYEDFEVNENSDDEEESEDDEDNNPVESGNLIEGEAADANDERDDAPPVTPEAARQARAEMLKRFIEAVEARMKVLRAT